MVRWWRVALVVAAVWLVALGVVWFVRSAKVTAASLERYVAEHPLAGASAAGRARIVDGVASRLNRLDMEERRAFRRDPELRRFFEELTPEERGRFLDLTLPEGFRQMMQALNAMEPEQRKRFVDRALSAIESGRGPDDAARAPLDDAQRDKIIQHGMSAFYEEASADVKLDLAPVIEQLQRQLQRID